MENIYIGIRASKYKPLYRLFSNYMKISATDTTTSSVPGSFFHFITFSMYFIYMVPKNISLIGLFRFYYNNKLNIIDDFLAIAADLIR